MPCSHLLGKGWPLGSCLWCLIVTLSLSHWYPGSGVVLDCIDSWSLPSFLIWIYFTAQILTPKHKNFSLHGGFLTNANCTIAGKQQINQNLRLEWSLGAFWCNYALFALAWEHLTCTCYVSQAKANSCLIAICNTLCFLIREIPTFSFPHWLVHTKLQGPNWKQTPWEWSLCKYYSENTCSSRKTW